MKKYIYMCLVMIISISLILGACSSGASTTTSAPTTQAPTTTQAPATTTAKPAVTSTAATTTTAPPSTTASGKVYEFKYTDAFPPQSTTALFGETLAKVISEKTNGRVKFTFFHAEALGKQGDFLKMLNGGVVDAATCSVSPYPADFDMELGLELPGLGIKDRKSRLDITWSLYGQGYFTGLKPYKVLGFGATPPLSMFLKKKVNNVAELKGLKIRSTAAPMSRFIELLGGTPVTVPSAEAYQALERGIIDGAVTAYEAFIPSKQYEVAKFALTDPLAIGCLLFLMNQDKWNSLPPDIQAQVNEGIEAFKVAFLETTKGPDATWMEDARKLGMDVYAFSPEEAAKLKAIAAPIKDEWINAHETKGLPANAMIREVDNYLASHK